MRRGTSSSNGLKESLPRNTITLRHEESEKPKKLHASILDEYKKHFSTAYILKLIHEFCMPGWEVCMYGMGYATETVLREGFSVTLVDSLKCIAHFNAYFNSMDTLVEEEVSEFEVVEVEVNTSEDSDIKRQEERRKRRRAGSVFGTSSSEKTKTEDGTEGTEEEDEIVSTAAPEDATQSTQHIAEEEQHVPESNIVPVVSQEELEREKDIIEASIPPLEESSTQTNQARAVVDESMDEPAENLSLTQTNQGRVVIADTDE